MASLKNYSGDGFSAPNAMIMVFNFWSIGVIHNLDFKILISDLRTNCPAKQLVFNTF